MTSWKASSWHSLRMSFKVWYLRSFFMFCVDTIDLLELMKANKQTTFYYFLSCFTSIHLFLFLIINWMRFCLGFGFGLNKCAATAEHSWKIMEDDKLIWSFIFYLESVMSIILHFPNPSSCIHPQIPNILNVKNTRPGVDKVKPKGWFKWSLQID